MSLNALSPAKIKENRSVLSPGANQLWGKGGRGHARARTDGEDVRWRFTQGLSLISLDSLRRVEILHLVIWIHGYQNVGDVSLKFNSVTGDIKMAKVEAATRPQRVSYSRISCPWNNECEYYSAAWPRSGTSGRLGEDNLEKKRWAGEKNQWKCLCKRAKVAREKRAWTRDRNLWYIKWTKRTSASRFVTIGGRNRD